MDSPPTSSVDGDDLEVPSPLPTPPPSSKLVLPPRKQTETVPLPAAFAALDLPQKETNLETVNAFGACLARIIECGADEIYKCYEREIDSQNRKWTEMVSRQDEINQLQARIGELEHALSESKGREAHIKKRLLEYKEKKLQKNQEKVDEQKKLEQRLTESTTRIQELEQTVKKQKVVIDTLNNAISGNL